MARQTSCQSKPWHVACYRAAPAPRSKVACSPPRGLRPPPASLCSAPQGACAPRSKVACSPPWGLRPPPRFAVLGPSRGLRGLYQRPSQSLGSAGYMARQTSCQSKPWHAACYRAAPAKTYRLCAPSRAAIRGL